MGTSCEQPTRRDCLAGGAALAAAWLSGSRSLGAQNNSPTRRVVVGVMGTSRDLKGGDGRGSHLAATLATLPGVHVAYICDVDQRNIPKAIESVSKHLRDELPPPKGVGDFRRILEDREVDAMVTGGDAIHLQNFVDSIRGEGSLNAPIDEGYKSVLLCNLGNIAYRTGHVVHFDPEGRRIQGDPQASALWSREYREGWEPKV